MKSRKIFVHWVSPILGAAVLIYALWSASDNAKVVGLGWLAIGVLIAVYFRMTGRSLAQADLDNNPVESPAMPEESRAKTEESRVAPAIITEKER